MGEGARLDASTELGEVPSYSLGFCCAQALSALNLANLSWYFVSILIVSHFWNMVNRIYVLSFLKLNLSPG